MGCGGTAGLLPSARCLGAPVARGCELVGDGDGYEPAAVSTFLQVSDYYLVAQAHAYGYTVVTHEIPSASVRRIKIPDVCLGIGIKVMTPVEQLCRREHTSASE